MLIHMYYDGKRARKFIGVVEKQKPVIEIILHWKGLTQGYSTYGGYRQWAPDYTHSLISVLQAMSLVWYLEVTD